MAALTKLESKLAEVLGLAGAAKDAVDAVKGMLDEAEQRFGATLDRMKQEAAATEERSTEVIRGFEGKKTAILEEARSVRGDARHGRVAQQSLSTKAQGRGSRLLPDGVKAEMHRRMAEPGSAEK